MCLHIRRDALTEMRDLFGVIKMELRVKSLTLINPRSKIYSIVQLHVCVYFFVYLLNKNSKNQLKENSLAFFKRSFCISSKENVLKKKKTKTFLKKKKLKVFLKRNLKDFFRKKKKKKREQFFFLKSFWKIFFWINYFEE